MRKETPDDTPVVTPDISFGRAMMAGIEEKAREVYPDHSGSREQYVREKVIQKLDELSAEALLLEGCINGESP